MLIMFMNRTHVYWKDYTVYCIYVLLSDNSSYVAGTDVLLVQTSTGDLL